MKFMGLIPLSGDGAEKAAQRGTQSMAQGYQHLWNQYMPSAMGNLYNEYTNPRTAWDSAAMNTLNANTMRDYQAADNQLQRSMVNRGIGNSSYTQNGLGQLWNSYGQTMANARFQQNQELERRRQAALQGILGYAHGAGQNALGAWNQTAQIGAQRGAEQNAGIMSGLSAIGSFMGGLPMAGLQGVAGGGVASPITGGAVNAGANAANAINSSLDAQWANNPFNRH